MENNTISTWDRLMMAITFAEVGEHETAREMLNSTEEKQRAELAKKAARRPELRS